MVRDFFEHSDRAKDYIERVRAFIAEEVAPLEEAARLTMDQAIEWAKQNTPDNGPDWGNAEDAEFTHEEAKAAPTAQAAANDAAFEAMPSASAERNGANGKTIPASAHDPSAPWDDNRKAEAVRWAMRRYPEVYNHVKPWQLSLDHLLEKAASEGMDAAQIAQAWKDKCESKQVEIDAKKLQAELDKQAAAQS